MKRRGPQASSLTGRARAWIAETKKQTFTGTDVAEGMKALASEVRDVQKIMTNLAADGLIESTGKKFGRQTLWQRVVKPEPVLAPVGTRPEASAALVPAPPPPPGSSLGALLEPLVQHIVAAVVKRVDGAPADLGPILQAVHTLQEQVIELTRGVEGLVGRVGTLEKDAGLLLENLTKPAVPPGLPPGQYTANLDAQGKLENIKPAEPRPRKPRIMICGLEGSSGMIEREFPGIDIRFVGPDDSKTLAANGVEKVYLMTKWIPHELARKATESHAKVVKITGGLSQLREALREYE